jgi:PAS domain S-box-containing protein
MAWNQQHDAPHQLPTKWGVVVLILVMAGILIIDALTALGLTVGMLYVPVVVATLWLGSPVVTMVAGCVALVFTLVGWVVSPASANGVPEYYFWLNRVISLGVIAVTMVITLARFNVQRDLLEQRKAGSDLERRLQEQHRLLTAASTVGAVGGWHFDIAEHKLRWSDEVARIHGLRPESGAPSLADALGFYHEDDRPLVEGCVKQALDQGRPFEFDARIRHRDGHIVWVRSAGQPKKDSDGRIIAIEGSFIDITARKQADDARRLSLLRFKRLAETMPLIVWTADERGELDYITQAFFDYAGFSTESGANEHWIDSLHPDDRTPCMQRWRESIRTGQEYSCEFRVRRHDGQYRWHRAYARLIRDHDEAEVKWYGAAIEIHDQKLAVEQATALAQRLGQTLESITDAFFTLDGQWRFSFLNRRAEQVLHRTRDELLGKNVWVEFPEAVGTVFETEYRRAMLHQCPVVFEQYYPPLETWFEVHAYPSDNGLAVYFQDVTDRVNRDAQLRLLQTAIAHLNDVVIITDAEPIDDPGPRIVFVNDAFERRTGYTREEIIGKTPRLLQGPQTSLAELTRIRNALRRWQPVRAELCNYTKSGEIYWVELEIVPLANEKGWFTHWVAIERDVTERHLLQAKLDRLQRMEAVGQLTGGVAHDFNNLLTVMLGNAELLAEELQGNRTLAEHARLIVQAGSQGAQLTQRLLAFARRQPLEPQPLSVNEVVSSLEELLRRTLGEHIELEFVIAPDAWPAMVDPSQLEDALLNLALNARDAMPTGGRLTIETGNVHLSDDYAESQVDIEPGDYVMLAVSDTGCGIAAKDQKRLFEPFFTTKAKGKGTGLGLAMVYGFIKQSGGHISVYSEQGQGTTFRLYLPRSLQAPRAIAPVEDIPLHVPGGETILLVEDDPLVRKYAHDQLQALGYTVISAPGGSQALEVIQTAQPIDLLFTDVIMPGGMSGRELADRAKGLRPGLKVLYTSGYTENAIVHHGRLDPGVLLLSKPYRRIELARKIRQALGEPDADRTPNP